MATEASTPLDGSGAVPEDGLGPVVEMLAGLSGTVLVVGIPDAGKTTLIDRVARNALERRKTVGIVDSDLGQSNIGPPGCVGMTVFSSAPAQFRVRRPDRLSFVGATSPPGFFLDIVSGVCALAAECRESDAGLVLVDTSGAALTSGGFRLKEEKLMRLRPEHLVLVEKNRELFPLAQLARATNFCTVHRVPVSPRAHLKPSGIRRVHRKRTFEEYFRGSREQRLPAGSLGIRGVSVLSGRALSPQARVRVAEILEVPVLRAAFTGTRLAVVTARSASHRTEGQLQQRFPKLQVSVLRPNALDSILVGLVDGDGRTLEIGIVKSCDFSSLSLTVLTPLTAVDRVRMLQFGVIRLRSDGTELAGLRPGEL